ncbi:AsnC family protein [Bacillus thuringiensis]|nr:AsnC family protein [Bacillus thuringiensis]MED2759995.1 AsnC family protein [Bacillus thuringiensis]MED2769489.1 AsnC family protein [Bacillus thuringiensis]MED2777739.1 AsnC family protein [Bacillus thuringiensis]MED2784014.1 AsnC family protein [Bacillus thuringiensis]
MSEAIRKSQEETFIEEWQECYLSEGKKTGYVVTIDLSKDISKQIWYGLNDTKQLLRSSRMSLKDIYLSLNAFVHGSRRTSDLRQIRNIGVDLDFYKLGLTREHVMEELNRVIAKGTIPCPNVTLHGRGMQLIYSISGGAAPIMGYKAQYITNHFIKSLMHLGADGACSDLSRVFRLPHSVHSKTGKQIEVDIWTKREYQLTELYEYVPPMEKKRPTKRRGIIETLPAPKGVMTLYSLNTARKVDLEKIVEMRKGEIDHRHDMTYIYAFTTALIVKHQGATVEMTLQLNDRFTDPQKTREVERTAKDAYKDAITFFDAYAKNDFEMKGLPRNLIKPMKNTTVMDKLNLNLTQDEIEHLTTLISKGEKQRRNTNYQKEKRRKKGVKPREKYLEKKIDKLEIMRKAKKKHPEASVRQLVEITGLTKSTIARLSKLL